MALVLNSQLLSSSVWPSALPVLEDLAGYIKLRSPTVYNAS